MSRTPAAAVTAPEAYLPYAHVTPSSGRFTGSCPRHQLAFLKTSPGQPYSEV